MPDPANRIWLSRSEIAGLLGAPTGVKDVSRWARRHNVARRPRKGRGGGYEYDASTMPQSVREALGHIEISMGDGAPDSAAPGAPIYKESFSGDGAATEAPAINALSVDAVSAARLEILTALSRRESGDLFLTEARRRFVAAYRRREAGCSDSTYTLIPHISIRSLLRWRRDLESEGAEGLAPEYNCKPSGLAPHVADAVLAQLHTGGPHATTTNIHALLTARYGDEAPSLRSIQRWIKRWRERHIQAATYLDSPEKWRSVHQVAFGRFDEGVVRPNQIWELDSTIADVALAAPSGEMRLRRYALVGVIDVWSRRLMYQLAPTSSSAAIAQLLRRALVEWGVPEALRLDNGRDYASERVALLAGALAIRIEHCRPFHPEDKPCIERSFRTISTAMEMLPGYVGHSVAERQHLRARERARARAGEAPVDLGSAALSPTEMQAWLDNWTENDYGRRTHGRLGCSPWERANSWKGAVRCIEDERILDVLFEPIAGGGIRTVLKRGIQVGRRWYVAPELGAHVGERVRCYRDPDDHGRLCIYGEDTWICWAVDAEGTERKEIAAQARAVQRKSLRAELGRIRGARRTSSAGEAWQEIAVARAEEAERIRGLPQLAEAHTTSMTEAAAEAAAAREEMDAPVRLRKTLEADTQAHIERLREERAATADPYARPKYWKSERHRYLWCRRNYLAGREGSFSDRDWEFIAYYERKYRVSLSDRMSRPAEIDKRLAAVA